MEEWELPVVLILVVLTCWYWLYRFIRYLLQPVIRRPDFSFGVLLIFINCLIGGSGTAILLFDEYFADFWIEIAPELIGIAITVLIIERFTEEKIKQQEKQRIISQMGSYSNDFALEAVRQGAKDGWLRDGTLKGTYLNRADLSGGKLWRAYLSECSMSRINLENADLGAATMHRVDLYKANLNKANLTKADLSDSKLKRALMYNANCVSTNFANCSFSTP